MNDKLEELEFWIQKEIDNSEKLKHDVLIGRHHEGMIAAYGRVIRKIYEMKGESNDK